MTLCFNTVNFPYLCNKIPSSATYWYFLFVDSIRRGMLYVCTISLTWQAADSHVDKTRLSTVTIEVNVS